MGMRHVGGRTGSTPLSQCGIMCTAKSDECFRPFGHCTCSSHMPASAAVFTLRPSDPGLLGCSSCAATALFWFSASPSETRCTCHCVVTLASWSPSGIAGIAGVGITGIAKGRAAGGAGIVGIVGIGGGTYGGGRGLYGGGAALGGITKGSELGDV